MLKIKTKRLWWATIAAIIASYPAVVWAEGLLVQSRILPAPFLLSWTGVWVFAIAGGVCAAFVKMPEIDARFYYPSLAKALIGMFSGVALSLFIDVFTSTQSQTLPLFSLLAGLFSAPLVAGTMVWISNQRRIDRALNQTMKRHTSIDTSLDSDFRVDTDYRRSDNNDTTDLS